MPRINIDKATIRNRLQPRREPYWGAPIARGLFLGFRRTEFGGTWIARLHDEDKRHRYHSIGVQSATLDYEAARVAALAWKRGVDAGVKADAGAETVADACRDYVDALKRDGRVDAATDTERRFERTVYHDPIGKRRLARLSQDEFEAWRDRVERGDLAPLPVKKGRPSKAKPLSKASVNRMRTPLVAALNRAVMRRKVSPDRAIEWESVRPYEDANNRREVYLDRQQRGAWMDAAGADLRDVMECIALTGCRPGDPAAMLRKDYDARHASAKFKTKNHERVVPVSPAAKALFDRLAKNKLPNAPLFTNGGREWKHYDWAEQAREAATAAGMPDSVVLYTLRHCWITDAIIGGIDLLTVAKLSGTSLAMIEKHYGHLVHDAARGKLAAIQFV